jgi:hypothetical protein
LSSTRRAVDFSVRVSRSLSSILSSFFQSCESEGGGCSDRLDNVENYYAENSRFLMAIYSRRVL